MKGKTEKMEAKCLKRYRDWLRKELGREAPKKPADLVGGKHLPDLEKWIDERMR
jgi:hypothetical protein